MRGRAIGIGLLALLIAAAGSAPATAVPNYQIYVHDRDGYCTALGIKGSLTAKTINTDWDPCGYVLVKAKYQPPAAGGATWTAWRMDEDEAKYSYSTGTVVDAEHWAAY